MWTSFLRASYLNDIKFGNLEHLIAEKGLHGAGLFLERASGAYVNEMECNGKDVSVLCKG